MRSAGVAVEISSKSRPTAQVVIVDGSWGNAQVLESFALTSATDDLATQLHDLFGGLRSGLSDSVERVVIRRADTPWGSNKEGPRLRLLAEGALAAAAKSVVADVVILKAKDLAQRTPAGAKEAL